MDVGIDRQVQFIENYFEYVDMVIDGLQLAVQMYNDGQTPSGDRLLQDLMSGFDRFNEENMTMYAIFGSGQSGEHEWAVFREQCRDTLSYVQFESDLEKVKALTTDTIPVFQRWKLFVQQLLDQKREETAQSK